MFGLKNTYCFVVFTDENNQCCLWSLPHLAGCPPTMLHLGVGVTGVLLQSCTALCCLKWVRCPDHLNPHQGEESLLYRMEEGGREGNEIFFFFFFSNLYRGFIAVLKYVRSYLHSLSLVTETNKIIYCKHAFSTSFL